MMQAAANGQNAWKAGALSLFLSVVSYGIEAAFVGSFGESWIATSTTDYLYGR